MTWSNLASQVRILPVRYMGNLLTALDSKTLNAATRSSLLDTLCSDPSNLGWSVRVLA